MPLVLGPSTHGYHVGGATISKLVQQVTPLLSLFSRPLSYPSSYALPLSCPFLPSLYLALLLPSFPIPPPLI